MKIKQDNQSERALKIQSPVEMQGIIKDCGEIANTIWFKAKVLYFQKLKRYSAFANYLENQIPAVATQYYDWIVC